MIIDEMKKKRVRIVIVIFCLILLFLIHKGQKDYSISKVSWQYLNKKCSVSFVIENKTSSYLPLNISLRAHKQEYVHGSDAMLTEIVNEQIVKIELKPNEIRNVQESFHVSSRNIYLVTVNAWNTGN